MTGERGLHQEHSRSSLTSMCRAACTGADETPAPLFQMESDTPSSAGSQRGAEEEQRYATTISSKRKQVSGQEKHSVTEGGMKGPLG